MIENEEFKITRIFNAPRKLLFKVHTEAKDMSNWFGPQGFKIEVLKLDLSPEGIFLFCLTSPEGLQIWRRFVYREIVLNEKIIFISSFSNKEAQVTRNPMNANWPLEILYPFIFTKKNENTELSLRATPINANEVETKTFEAAYGEMQTGRSEVFDQLEDYLDFVQK